VPSHTCACHISDATTGNLRRRPGARAVHVRLLDSEYRVQARGAAEPRCVRGLVEDRVLRIRLHEEYHTRRARCPVQASEGLAPERVEVEVVDTPPFNCRAVPNPSLLVMGSSKRISAVIWQKHAVLMTGNCVYEYSPSTEYMHMHIQGERLREGPGHAQKFGQVQHRGGVRMVLSCCAVNKAVPSAAKE
jgi:hypothetical protein